MAIVHSLIVQQDQLLKEIASDRKLIRTVLLDLALTKEVPPHIMELQVPILKRILGLSYGESAERRLFCLELYFLLQDECFPVNWNKKNLELLLRLQKPFLPVSGLEELLIPFALQEGAGRSFQPLLSELSRYLIQLPSSDLHWTILLNLIQREVSIPQIADLFNSKGFGELSVPQLYKVLKLDLIQLKVFAFFLDQYKTEKVKFDLAFYFIKHLTFDTESLEKASQLIHQFIWEVLPLAETRCNEFGQTYFRKAGKQEVANGFRKALELFYLWLLHCNPLFTGWFYEAPLAISEEEAKKYVGLAAFREVPFEQVIRFLPDFCLWEVGLIANQNKELLIHLASRLNIRSFPHLCLPMPKKVAHAFHQLRPDEVPVYSHLNDLIYQLFGQYLQLNDILMRIASHYMTYIWIRHQSAYFYRRHAKQNKSKFVIWESVLRKWATWLAADPTLGGLSNERIWFVFSYIQHVVDEKKSIRLKGVNLRSLHRRATNWRREIQAEMDARERATAIWPGAAYTPFNEEREGISYQIVQLTTAESLREEGQLMRHCVLSYRHRCARGECSIWSLRKIEQGRQIPLVTMEINSRRQMVQVKGRCNRTPNTIYRAIIKEWATREGIWGG